ncbi:13576_t:CDS:2, partial [Gigaspora rosea]
FIEACPCWLCENFCMRNNIPSLRNPSQAILYHQTRNLVFFPPENDSHHLMVPLTNNHMITSQPAFRTNTSQDQLFQINNAQRNHEILPSNLMRNYESQQPPPNNRNDQIFQAMVSHAPFQPTELNRDSPQHQLTPVQANIQINNNLQNPSQTSNLSDQSL